MSFQVFLSRRARIYISKLDGRAQARFERAIERLAENPFGPGTKPLTAIGGRSMRVGGWRIRYDVDVAGQRIEVNDIAPRGQAYRDR